jgi:flagellar hook-length control protein FliK
VPAEAAAPGKASLGQNPAQDSSSGESSDADRQPVAPTQTATGSSAGTDLANQGNVTVAGVVPSTPGAGNGPGQNGTSQPHATVADSAVGQAQTGETETPGLVTARMVESAQQAEVRVGVHPDGMGPIEIRAVLRGDEVGAAISAQQPDTHQWLASHLGELENTLHAHDIRLAQLSLSEPSASGSLASGYSQSDSQGQARGQHHAQLPMDGPEPETAGPGETENNPAKGEYARNGVDLRA